MTWCRREEGAGSPQDMTEEGSVWWSEGGAGVGESPQIGLEVRGDAFTRTGTERRKVTEVRCVQFWAGKICVSCQHSHGGV